MEKKDIIVSVTEKHIKEGSKRSCFDCPIAYAVIEALSENKYQQNYWYSNVSVTDTISIPRLSYSNMDYPDEMKQWIIDFDKGKTVRPFKFKIHFRSTFPSHAEIQLV